MKTIMIVVAVLFAASMFYGLSFSGLPGGGGGQPSNVLAKVNGRAVDPMRYQELINRIAQNFGQNATPSDMAMIDNLALGQAVDFTLLQQAAEKKVKVSGGEIDAALDSIMKQQNIPSKRELENALKKIGLSVGKFRDFIKGDIIVQKLQMKLQAEVKVTPDDLREVMRKFPKEKEPEKIALREKQQNAFRSFYSEIRSKAKIEIVNPLLKAHDFRFRGRLNEAIAEYQKAISQMPTNPMIHVYLGDAYMAAGRKDLALAEYENAVKVEGGNPDLYLVLGKVYLGMGEKGLATDQFRKASLIAGDNKATHEKLLKLFQQMKRPAEAAREQAEIKRLEKKEKFEKEITGSR
ncbi:hypothetical protein A3D23_07280 [candidate division WOR-1 bacterium RIFCSPHIGHO2_02_FULL_53_26]|nr:MAG: hypothetical protein A3D23_07280 [candidate division WOR-1 bacterium RIFCSPHIGHO2_02_FULL_53_26]